MVRIEVKILGSGREVGRAAVAVGSDSKYLLLDYGVNFDERDVPQFPLHVRPSELVGLVLTHAHLDHIGAAPVLYTTSRLPSVMTPVTRALLDTMLKDFIKISGYYLPFEYIDVEALLENTITLEFNRVLDFEDFTVRLRNAGHIPGSAMVEVEIGGVKLLYTGDVNTIDTRLVKGAETELEADILVIEGTYGNSIHPKREVIEKEFIDAVKEVIEAGGNVLIPAFSLGRSQEILTLLYEKLSWADVFYDGMIRVINDVFLSYPEYINKYELLAEAIKEFRMVRNSGERRALVKGGGRVIVASAGMLKGGPAAYYLKKLGDNPRNAVYLVSYQAPITPGRKLLEEGRTSDKENTLIKARVQWFDFSSHAGADGLMELLEGIKGLKKVVVVHSDEEPGKALVKRITERFTDVDVYFPLNGESLTFDL